MATQWWASAELLVSAHSHPNKFQKKALLLCSGRGHGQFCKYRKSRQSATWARRTRALRVRRSHSI